MAIIVQHYETNKKFILLGTSYSYYKDSRPSFLGGTLFPHQDEGEIKVVAVCDEKGEIEWIRAFELTVIEIDGVTPDSILMK